MCNENNNKSSCCLAKTLETILLLQQNKDICDIPNDCSKPFLGPTNTVICLNTRPLNLYTCCSGTLWSMPYTLNDEESQSSVFRIENLDECCATFRILAPNNDDTTNPYIATNDFFIINLNCISNMQCLTDTFVQGI